MVEVSDGTTESNKEKRDLTEKIWSKVQMMLKVMKMIQEDVYEIKQKMVKVKVDEVKVDEDKEKINKAFEQKGIGRPAGSFESKQKQYLDMLNKGKIKQPKEKTLEFYKIAKDKHDKYYLWPDD